MGRLECPASAQIKIVIYELLGARVPVAAARSPQANVDSGFSKNERGNEKRFVVLGL